MGLLCLVACQRSSPAATGGGQSGAVSVSAGSQILLEGPADAAWCDRDSAVALVVTGREWVLALVVRSVWPLDTAATFAMDSTLGGVGSAALALRPVGDSVRAAYLGRAGSLRLQAGAVLKGDFDARATTTAGDSLAVRATLASVIVRNDGCPPPDSVPLR
jgi:hypothetical protein